MCEILEALAVGAGATPGLALCAAAFAMLYIHMLARHSAVRPVRAAVAYKGGVAGYIDCGWPDSLDIMDRLYADLESGQDVKVLLHVCAQHHIDAGAAQCFQLI